MSCVVWYDASLLNPGKNNLNDFLVLTSVDWNTQEYLGDHFGIQLAAPFG